MAIHTEITDNSQERQYELLHTKVVKVHIVVCVWLHYDETKDHVKCYFCNHLYFIKEGYQYGENNFRTM